MIDVRDHYKTTKCATCPISCGCSWGCIRGDDLAEIARLREVQNAAAMAKTRLDDFADRANAGQIHYSARELKRKIGAAFAEFDAALEQKGPSDVA